MSGLKYRTGEEVQLGDVIRTRVFFFWPRVGTVCYIPGISPVHPALEYEDIRQWAFQTASGTVYAATFDPDHYPLIKATLIQRGPAVSLDPDLPLE